MTNYHHISVSPALFILLCLSLAAMFSVCATSEVRKNTQSPPTHHHRGGFKNIHADPPHGFGALLKWRFGLGPYEKVPVKF